MSVCNKGVSRPTICNRLCSGWPTYFRNFLITKTTVIVRLTLIPFLSYPPTPSQTPLQYRRPQTLRHFRSRDLIFSNPLLSRSSNLHRTFNLKSRLVPWTPPLLSVNSRSRKLNPLFTSRSSTIYSHWPFPCVVQSDYDIRTYVENCTPTFSF